MSAIIGCHMACVGLIVAGISAEMAPLILMTRVLIAGGFGSRPHEYSLRAPSDARVDDLMVLA